METRLGALQEAEIEVGFHESCAKSPPLPAL